MKKLIIVIYLLLVIPVYSQIVQLYWDLDGDKVRDLTYTCSDGDTITAQLYLTYPDSTNIVADKPIYVFDIPVLYGYYTVWNTDGDYYSNILTLNTASFDTSAVLDTTGLFNYFNNSSLKRFNISYKDTADSAITADSCIAIFTFIVSGTGNQLLHFYYLGDENNYTIWYNTVVLNDRLVPYKLYVYDCKIISQ